jgi:ribosome assembly protein 3
MAQENTSPEFSSYYLQQAAKEFAEDLDKVRKAHDFKDHSVTYLVHALQQGTSLFSAADQERLANSAAAPSDDQAQKKVAKTQSP